MSSSAIFDHLKEIKLRDLPRNLASQCVKRKWSLACAFFYLILALVLTWPVVSSPFSTVPIGTQPTASVPLYNTWATWWNADRLAGGLFGYWDAPIFFPIEGSFCLSEPQPTTMMVAPVIWITGSRILAYNIYIWISLSLNGLFAQRLAQTFGMGRWTALWAGTAMVLLPIVHWQLGISQLAPLWAILWTLTAIEQLCRTPTKRNGLTLGIAASLAFVTCMHHGLFLAILLIGAAPTLWRHWIRPKEIKCWGVALAVALIFTVPFVSQVKSVTEIHAIDWEKDLITDNSAKVTDYLHAPSDPYLRISFDWGTTVPLFLSPGAIKYLLAIIGIVFGLRNPQFRRWASFLLAIAILAFSLSLGPNLRLGDFQPWWWLSEHIPGFDRVRSVMRFAFFVQISVIIFAALGMTIASLRGEDHRTVLYRTISGAGFLVSLVVLVDALWHQKTWALPTGDASLTFFPANAPFIIAALTGAALLWWIAERTEVFTFLSDLGRVSLTVYVLHFFPMTLFHSVDEVYRMSSTLTSLLVVGYTLGWMVFGSWLHRRAPHLTLEALMKRREPS